MNYDKEIQILKEELNSLRDAFIQSQRNQATITEKTDSTANKVADITPYVESKTAYIDDTEVTFDVEKDGILTVRVIDEEGQNVPYQYEWVNGHITVMFEQRKALATVTISIQ